MTKFQRFVSYLALGNSIFWAYFLISGCPKLHAAGQGAVALLAPVLIGTPINIACLLIFLILARYAIRKKIKNSSQIFGMEAGLIWGAILVLNAWFVIGISCFWIKWSHSVINPPKKIVRFDPDQRPIWLRIPCPVSSSVPKPITKPSIANRPFQVSAKLLKPNRVWVELVMSLIKCGSLTWVRLWLAAISQLQLKCCKELQGSWWALGRACLMPMLWHGRTSR